MFLDWLREKSALLPSEYAGQAEEEEAGEDVEHVVHRQPHHQPGPGPLEQMLTKTRPY